MYSCVQNCSADLMADFNYHPEDLQALRPTHQRMPRGAYQEPSQSHDRELPAEEEGLGGLVHHLGDAQDCCLEEKAASHIGFNFAQDDYCILIFYSSPINSFIRKQHASDAGKNFLSQEENSS